MKNTLTKFCQTAKKVGKQVVEKAKSGVAFGAGAIKQSLSNNGIILPINSRLSRWLEQDWINQNPAYNTGVFIGQLAGLAQAATEYVGAGLTFAAGTAGSGVLDAFVGVASGGTAAAAIPAMAVAEMDAVTAATEAIGAHASKVLKNNFNSRNYSSSSGNSKDSAERLGYKKTNECSHGQPVYKNTKGKPKYITPDVDSHNGGIWKGADTIKGLQSKRTRSGTYDGNLNRIGD
ncbi:toxin C-terminal domain-containing protein [Enterococcus faecalis]